MDSAFPLAHDALVQHDLKIPIVDDSREHAVGGDCPLARQPSVQPRRVQQNNAMRELLNANLARRSWCDGQSTPPRARLSLNVRSSPCRSCVVARWLAGRWLVPGSPKVCTAAHVSFGVRKCTQFLDFIAPLQNPPAKQGQSLVHGCSTSVSERGRPGLCIRFRNDLVAANEPRYRNAESNKVTATESTDH